MKRYWQKIMVLAAAAVMSVLPVMTVCAETAKEGEVYTLRTIKTSWESGVMERQDIDMNVLFSEHQLLTEPEVAGWAEKQLPQIEGAEWKKIYMYRNKEAAQNTDFRWELQVENSANWKVISQFGIEEGKVNHLRDFSIYIGGVEFSACKLYGGAMGDYSTEDGLSGEHCLFVLVPVGYTGDIVFTLYGSKMENGEYVKNEEQKLTYLISGHSKDEEAMQEAIKEAEEEEKENTPVWKSDDKGWWLERSDGSYITKDWYQSPESGFWYYMGEDGYMLTNTTTPDGYWVNADGVYIEK